MKKLHQRYVSRRKGSFFKKSFVLILLIACIPGLLTGAGIYLFSAAVFSYAMFQGGFVSWF
ncbi:hypothetical protein MOF42_18635, partial [Bacillus haynesii]|uniref:hypothetical protein n=1 Tax=Bacillus haynesii TaxID=1925021 RepID=UPI0022814023